MCGIVTTFASTYIDLQRSLDALSPRGPDGTGTAHVKLPWAQVSIGSTRLAIVGGSTVPVPFSLPGTGITIAFNGEIYNWRALRREIGGSWSTECDVEVIARAWQHWGEKCIDRFNGMFAFVLIDTDRGIAFAARDRAGEKPLYYSIQDGAIHLASEIKALPIDFYETSCPDLDLFEFDCLETTPFRGIKVLLPGHYLTIKSLKDIEIHKWWELPYYEPQNNLGLEEIEETIIDAIRIRSENCEVPLSVQLSGGIDSSIVQAVVQTKNLYTVSLSGEEELAKLCGDPQIVKFDSKDLLEVLPRIAYQLDTPATWTAVCQWFLAKRMREDGMIVTLSGEGADELFGGYSRYRILWYLDEMKRDRILHNYGPLNQYLIGSDEEILARLIDRSDGSKMDRVLEIVHKYGGEGDLVTRAMRIDWHTTMQCLLRMADRMTSAFGMENRAPFLDHRVIELAMRIPSHFRMGGAWSRTESRTKAVLREVARRLGVDYQIYNDTNKRGLIIPWAKWFPQEVGNRGVWSRTGFSSRMKIAWRSAFKLTDLSRDSEQPILGGCAA